MHTFLSLIIGLSEVVAVASVPAFALAMSLGKLRATKWKREWLARVVLFWAGVLGFLSLAICTLLAATDTPQNRMMDSIDRGLFLTGVPTVFAISFSCYALALVVTLIGFFVCRTIHTEQPT